MTKIKIMGVVTLIALLLLTVALYYSYTQSKRIDHLTMFPASVDVPQEMMDRLNDGYAKSTHEFSLCVEGNLEGDTLKVTDWYDAEIISSTEDEILTKDCERNVFKRVFMTSDVVGTIHNHPNGVCRYSEMDYYSFGSNNHLVGGVICGYNSLVIYTPKNLITSINVNII